MKLFGIALTVTLLAFATFSQAQTPQQRSVLQEPDFSDFEKGRLSSFPVLAPSREKIALLKRYNPRLAKEMVSRIKKRTTSLDRTLEFERRLVEINERIDVEEKKYRDGLVDDRFLRSLFTESLITLDQSNRNFSIYNDEMTDIYRDKVEDEYRIWDEFMDKMGSWVQARFEARRKRRLSMGLPERPLDGLKIKEEINAEFEEIKKAFSPIDGQGRAVFTKKEAEKPAEDEIIDAGGDGMLAGKGVRLSHLQRCGTMITGLNDKEEFGRVSTRCAGLTGGLVASQADYAAHCKRFADPTRFCPPPPGSKVKYLDQISEGDMPVYNTRTEFRGIDGTPFSQFCYLLHYRLVSSNNNDLIIEKIGQDGLHPIFKYDKTNQKLECFFLSKEQAKSLYAEFKDAGKTPVAATPAEIEKSSTSASSTDLNTGETTTSVKNPDGSRTVTITDKDGDILSAKTISKSPASASSTDLNTGETTTSVANPDGSRTITKTDAEGNVLSREKVR